MDSEEANVYLTTAEDQLKDAELAFREKSYALCAFLSASSAENAAAALIISLGARPSRKHRNSLVVHRLVNAASTGMRASLTRIIDSLKILEPHITKARYPILQGSQLIPPSKLYTDMIAKGTLTHARTAVAASNRLIKAAKTNDAE